jgi:hypothetical protein
MPMFLNRAHELAQLDHWWASLLLLTLDDLFK